MKKTNAYKFRNRLKIKTLYACLRYKGFLITIAKVIVLERSTDHTTIYTNVSP